MTVATSSSTRPSGTGASTPSGTSGTSGTSGGKRDAVLSAALDVARAALEGVAEPGAVGEHLGFEMLGERLGMHWFECRSLGYGGWRWGVSVARVPRAKVATVCETNLLPTSEAVLAPEWLPYSERLAPGDLGAGDTLPFRADDPNLEAGFEATGEEDVDQMAFFELGLGRPRVLSAEGREQAASRWYAGDGGPTAEVAVKAAAHCTTCGYFLPMAGALRATFGVCANEWSPSDGRVISLDHGCGAHSETEMDQPEPLSIGRPIVDELAVDVEGALNPTPPDATAQPEPTEQPDKDGQAEQAELTEEAVQREQPEHAEAEAAAESEAPEPTQQHEPTEEPEEAVQPKQAEPTEEAVQPEVAEAESTDQADEPERG